MKPTDVKIPDLGPCKIETPIKDTVSAGECTFSFVTDDDRIFFSDSVKAYKHVTGLGESAPTLELAGPRCKIYFDPPKSRAAIVTCGGLCPGINDVIRGIVMELYYRYGVKKICGIRYGYQGFVAKYGHDILELTPSHVSEIHKWGGTILASRRTFFPGDSI